MATLVLTAAVSSLGLSGWSLFAANFAATAIGTFIDSRLFGTSTKSEGPRLDEISLSNSTEGASIKRLYGRSRLGGTLIWATNFKEEVKTTKQKSGKGAGSSASSTEYSYSISFAIAFCEGGEELEYGRIWADNDLIDASKYTIRYYKGTETQSPDSYIQQIEGIENTPAYRGVAYIVFEMLPLAEFGNRIPQITIEITKPIPDTGPDYMENLVGGTSLLPSAGEFVYSTTPTVKYSEQNPPPIFSFPEDYKVNSEAVTINAHVDSEVANIEFSLDRMKVVLPEIETVNIIVSWFANDLRCGSCQIKPKVETRDIVTQPLVWVVDGIPRASADVLPDIDGSPVFGGTPSDHSIVECIVELKSRGLKVSFYPFLLMDILSGNTLPNPYSDNAASIGQSVIPWRGRITCSPAEGYDGTVNKTATAATQVAAFFGTATAGNFSISGTTVSWTGGADWGVRRMILHYAHLCVAAGGVDYFLVGTEMPGITKIRSSASVFPGVNAYSTLVTDVKAIVGADCEVGYAADWSEYHSYKAQDGTNDVYFNMDPLFTNSNLSFIGIDNYLPISDWRDGVSHLDYDEVNGPRSIYDKTYLASQMEGGELWDYFYASDSDRLNQIRTPIVDSEYGQHWLFRQKSIREWWLNDHYNRPGGVLPDENLLETSNNIGSASWTASGSPYITIGVSGDPLGGSNGQIITDDGTTIRSYHNTSGTGTATRAGESFSFSCYFRLNAAVTSFAAWRVNGLTTGTSSRIDMKMRHKTGEFFPQTVGSNITVLDHNITNIGGGWYRFYCDFCVATVESGLEVTIYPAFGQDSQSWKTDAASHTASGSIEIFGPMLCSARRGFVPYFHNSTSSPVDIRSNRTVWEPGGKKIIFTEYGCPAVDKGSNQPNVFWDPKSSESLLPYFSTGNRDDVVQRTYIEVFCSYWRDNAPLSPLTGTPMVAQKDMWVWAWDARPYPWFPNLSDVWSDGESYTLGHWMNGRAGSVTLPALVNEFMSLVGLQNDIDVSSLTGASTIVNGYVIDNIMSPRDMLIPLFSAFQFDGYESGGKIKYTMRMDTTFTDIAIDDLVSTENNPGGFNIVRKQESELTTMARVSFIDEENSYQVGAVSGQKVGPETENVAEVKYPIIMPQSYARNVADILVQESWATREAGSLQLPISMARLDPTDGLRFTIGGREFTTRITKIETGEGLTVEFETHDPRIYTPVAFNGRPSPASAVLSAGRSSVEFLDIPMRTGEESLPWAPRVAAFQSPFPPAVNIYIEDTETSDLSLINQLYNQTQMGILSAPLTVGTPWVIDRVNTIDITVSNPEYQPLSVTLTQMLAGENALAVKNDAGRWEIIQYQTVAILTSTMYRLSNLLRGQLGTEVDMSFCPTGSRVVFLDPDSLVALQISQDQRELEFTYRYGPSNRITSHWSYTSETLQFRSSALMPYAPAGLVCEPITVGGDVIFGWKRRTRFGGDDWGTAEVPLNEANERYDLEICDLGGTVLRTLTELTSPTYTYTSADQTTDFGSPQSSFRIRVYQISDVVGRGHVADKVVSY